MRYLAIVGLLAVLAAPAMAADVTASVTVMPYAEIILPDGNTLALEISAPGGYYGPSGGGGTVLPGDHGGYLPMTVTANYSAEVSFGCLPADVVDCGGAKFAKVTNGTNVLGVLPAIGKGFWVFGGGGVTCQWADFVTGAPATIPGTIFPGALPVGLNQFTLFISASMDQTPDGSLAPEGVYTGNLVVTVAP